MKRLSTQLSWNHILGETVDVKLSCIYVPDIDDIYLSSSPLRPASACSKNDIVLIRT
jgi:hypothetical protein